MGLGKGTHVPDSSGTPLAVFPLILEVNIHTNALFMESISHTGGGDGNDATTARSAKDVATSSVLAEERHPAHHIMERLGGVLRTGTDP